jgi:hypothetical protein
MEAGRVVIPLWEVATMRWVVIASLLLPLSLVTLLPAQQLVPPEDKLVEKVRKAIDKGVAYLRREQRQGNWDVEGDKIARPGGWTALALLALLNSGVPPEDPAIQKGLAYLRSIPPAQTYVVGLQTMVFAQARQAVDAERIQRNVDWLLTARMADGWSYGRLQAGNGRADNSNTQYALLGLHEGLQAGATVDPKALQEIRQFYIDTQKRIGTGGWNYRPGEHTTMTMTTAGVCALLITGLDLAQGKQKLDDATGVAEACGEYDENKNVSEALTWIGRNFPSPLTEENAFETLRSPFYCLYGIERTGRLSGQRFFGGHDWYEVGCRYLVSIQKEDGSWKGANNRLPFDHWPIIATSFSLLFLSKGRTPVLLTKLAYGNPGSNDWNNKHSDMRHLVEFASRELFHKQPLAWQIFDVRLRAAETRESRSQLAAQLLQSPIVFFNGHDMAPRDKEEEILKEYLANGGFVFAEACCGRDDFDRDFRALMKRIFPDADLKPLPPEHPVWAASGKFGSSAKDFPLEGVQSGCKTVVIYSPKPLAGYWEENSSDKSARSQKAFRLGANVIAYATGLEAPRPRLTEVEIVQDDVRAPVKRGYLKVAQLRHTGDWQPAPRAMRNLLAEARKIGLDVVLEPTPVYPSVEGVLDFRFLYMHGRATFREKPEDLKHLRFNLKSGGTLFADACCGSAEFDKAFRQFMDALWQEDNTKRKEDDQLKLRPIPSNDELYSADLNGTAIQTVRCRREGPGGRVDPEYRTFEPALEGIKYNGRWVVIYSRYDIGCALENRQASNCLGHDHASALLLGKAALLYALKR